MNYKENTALRSFKEVRRNERNILISINQTSENAKSNL